MEDQNKIDSKISDLNGVNHAGGDWIAVVGSHALISVTGDFITQQNVVFNPASGLVVKIFINRRNGAIKLFPAVLFERT